MKTGSKKKVYAPQFKFDRALEVLKTNDASEIARKHGLNPNLLYLWRDLFLKRGAQVFENTSEKAVNDLQNQVNRLEQMLGKKEVELGLLKNFSNFYASRKTP